MSDSDFSTLVGSADDRHQMMLDEARKRGVLSPGGVFALIGELDYYQLIENLIRGPVTERQLMTPYRWWLFFKGSAFSSFIGTLLTLIRFALLLPGENMDFRIKYGTFLIFYFVMLFGFGNMFMKYTKYPDGATWTAVKYTLGGFSTGIIITETIKHILIGWSIYAKNFIAHHLYNRHWLLNEFMEVYYDLFVDSLWEEVVSLCICYIAVIYFWMYFYRISSYRRAALKTGKPYDLGLDN